MRMTITKHFQTFSDFSLNDDNEIFISEITENEILKCIRALKNGKAAGNDQEPEAVYDRTNS